MGCIYKEQPLKPSILDEYSGDRSLEVPPRRANYACHHGDGLVLEDESGRVALAPGAWGREAGGGGAPNAAWAALVGVLVSGVVLGVRGYVLPTGELSVEDVVVPGLGPAPPPAPPAPTIGLAS